MTRRSTEIESLADFDAQLAGTASLAGWFVRSVDLSDRGAALRSVDPQGAVFLGCRLDEPTRTWLSEHGALVFPTLPGLPFDPYRSGLYGAVELLAGARYDQSTDAVVYAWSREHRREELSGTLAVALHDHAIGDALDDALGDVDPHTVVGVMGGHALRRDEAGYADAARLGRRLARSGRVVLTGGGPGAMEAANLGAWYAGSTDAALDAALVELARVPSYRPSVDDWVRVALAVRDRIDGPPARTYGVPTWFYGHEPPHPFATGIAKYFGNALREDSLLHRSRGGLVVLPGAAGTVQEIFQAANENAYAATADRVAPIWLVGHAYWSEQLPAWALLRMVAARSTSESTDWVHLVDRLPELEAVGSAIMDR